MGNVVRKSKLHEKLILLGGPGAFLYFSSGGNIVATLLLMAIAVLLWRFCTIPPGTPLPEPLPRQKKLSSGDEDFFSEDYIGDPKYSYMVGNIHYTDCFSDDMEITDYDTENTDWMDEN
jgi:hypothetical protein